MKLFICKTWHMTSAWFPEIVRLKCLYLTEIGMTCLLWLACFKYYCDEFNSMVLLTWRHTIRTATKLSSVTRTSLSVGPGGFGLVIRAAAELETTARIQGAGTDVSGSFVSCATFACFDGFGCLSCRIGKGFRGRGFWKKVNTCASFEW